MIAPDAPARDPVRLTSPVTRGLLESAIVVVGLAAAVLFAALATYSPHDPSYLAAASPAPIHNGVGPVGARIADCLFYWFGRPAFLFPLLLLLPCWRLFRRLKAEHAVSEVKVVARLSGFLLVLVASCSLASMNWADWPRPQQSPGGVLGLTVGHEGLEQVIGYLGATLVLIALWMAGFSLFFGVSWFTIMDRIGGWVWSGFGWLPVREAPGAVPGEASGAPRLSPESPEARRAPERAPSRLEPEIRLPERNERAERAAVPPVPTQAFEPPSLGLLDDPPPQEALYSPAELAELGQAVVQKLGEFQIKAEVVDAQPGPVVTRFELLPGSGVKASQITGLAKDLARALAVLSVRVVEVIAGKSVMGLEISNKKRQAVALGEILRASAYQEQPSPLAVGLGKDIGGAPFAVDLMRMPHVLIAGTTGSGKSVTINAMILSLLYKSPPEQVRLIMIDPKMLELSVYEGIPHLLAPVVTDMRQAANALRWCVEEVDRRYTRMAALGVRNLAGYNLKVKESLAAGQRIPDPVALQRDAQDPGAYDGEIPSLAPLPYIVVIIDELADLMATVGKKVDELIARLAQKARASGIHLVLATQRPSVDVITGLIKANIPCRIAFQVSSRVDSRTILDQMGAETLLGHGDMLYLAAGTSMPIRVHGAFVSDEEVHRVVDDLRSKSPPNYDEEVLAGPQVPAAPPEESEGGASSSDSTDSDPLYDEAVRIVTTERKPSISYVQRRLKIGYNRAARLLEQMELAGLVGPLQANGAREVLAPAPQQEQQ